MFLKILLFALLCAVIFAVLGFITGVGIFSVLTTLCIIVAGLTVIVQLFIKIFMNKK